MIQAIGLTSMSRRKRLPTVDDLTFEARPGEVTVLLGQAGSGKSEALRLMLQLLPGRGVALFRGRSVHRIPHPAREIGVLLGDVPGHPARTARGHLRMLTAVAGVPVERADDVLDVVGLSGLAGQRLGDFSLGMDRRLGIATALLGDPHTLVLDEPAHGLSPREASWLHGLLRGYAEQGGLVLTSSRDPKEAARIGDRVVTIDGGRLVADQDAGDFSRTRLRPRVAVRTPHAERLAAVLSQEARGAERSGRGGGVVEVVCDGGSRISVYGSNCAAVGETAYRHGILVHQLAEEVGDAGDKARPAPLTRADGRAPNVQVVRRSAAMSSAAPTRTAAEAGSADRSRNGGQVRTAEREQVSEEEYAGEGERAEAAGAAMSQDRQAWPVEKALSVQPDQEERGAGGVASARGDEAAAGTDNGGGCGPGAEGKAGSGSAHAQVPAPLAYGGAAECEETLPLPVEEMFRSEPGSTKPAFSEQTFSGQAFSERTEGASGTAEGHGTSAPESGDDAPEFGSAASGAASASGASAAARTSSSPAGNTSIAARATTATAVSATVATSTNTPRITASATTTTITPSAATTGSSTGTAQGSGPTDDVNTAAGRRPAAPGTLVPLVTEVSDAAGSSRTSLEAARRAAGAGPSGVGSDGLPVSAVARRPGPAAPVRYEVRRWFGVRTAWVVMVTALLVALAAAVLMARGDAGAAGASGAEGARGELAHVLRLLAGWPAGVPFVLPPVAVAAGALGALAFGQEFRYPALAPAQVPVPRRLGLLLAKLLVTAGTAIGLCVFSALLNAGVLVLLYGTGSGVLTFPAHTFELASFTGLSAPGDGMTGLSFGVRIAALLALCVGCGWAGLLAAGVFRSTLGGLAAVAAVPLLIAPAARMLLSGPAAHTLDGLPERLRSALLFPMPSGSEQWVTVAMRFVSQPVGRALALALTVLLCAYVLTSLRSKPR